MNFLQKPLPPLQRNEKYIGLSYWVIQFALLPSLLGLLAAAFSPEYDATLLNVVYFSINFVCCVAIFLRLVKASLEKAKAEPEGLLFASAVGFGLYRAASLVLGIGAMVLFPDFANLNDSTLLEILGEHPLLMVVSTVLLAPVAEELLYRGLIFGWLREKNVYIAYILSALIFSGIHVVQYIGLYSTAHIVVALVLYLPAGLSFAWAYQHSGTILAPIIIHAANNLLAFLVLR